MAGVEGRSEYEGGGVMPNTVFPKGSEALTPADKLRLQSLTGQEDDSRAPIDIYHWHGNMRPDPNEEQRLARARRQEVRAREAVERNRYKESPIR